MEKVLLVLGASSEMGIAAIQDVKDDYDHIIAHFFHMNDSLRSLQETLGEKMTLIQADLSDEKQVFSLIETVNSANLVPTHMIHFPAQQIQFRRFSKTKWEDFERGFDISVKSLFLIAQSFLPKMAKAGYGKLIVMISYVVDGMPPKYYADYVVTKYALLGLVKSLAVEYAEKGITVNGISPSFVETRFTEDLPEKIRELNEASSPIGRNLNVQDIIPTVRFLLSDGSDCINGENLLITCGRSS